MTTSLLRWTATMAFALAIAFLLFAVSGGGIVGLIVSAGSSAAGPATVGIDFNTADDTAASVGSITTCLEVASGGSYTFDVYVQNVPGDTDNTTPDGMVSAQYTFNSISGNTDTARTATGGFIDQGAGIGVPGGAAIDDASSTDINNSTGSDTIVASNDTSIATSGASGAGFLVRMTYTAPTVATATIVSLTLTAVTLVDASANPIPYGPPLGATLIIAPSVTINCVNFPAATPSPSAAIPSPSAAPNPSLTAGPSAGSSVTLGASPQTSQSPTARAASPSPAGLATESGGGGGLPLAAWIGIGLGAAAIIIGGGLLIRNRGPWRRRPGRS